MTDPTAPTPVLAVPKPEKPPTTYDALHTNDLPPKLQVEGTICLVPPVGFAGNAVLQIKQATGLDCYATKVECANGKTISGCVVVKGDNPMLALEAAGISVRHQSLEAFANRIGR
jgi:hypothetical protein